MSKPLSGMPAEQKKIAIGRRLAQAIKGLGYWAAFDAVKLHQAEYKPFKPEKTK